MKSCSWVCKAIVLVLVFTMFLVAGEPSLAQSGVSSCISCHETEAKKPVRGEGQWHIQHNMLACEICHGGNPAATTQEAAHAGQISDPLAAGTSCSMCHPDASQEKILAYQALITPEAPAAEATLALLQDGCWVVATACAETTPTGVEPGMVITTPPAAGSTITTPVSAGTSTSAEGGTVVGEAANSASGYSWLKMLQFTRGPLFTAAFWFFVAGMLIRLIQALRSGWKHRVALDKSRRVAGVGKSFLTGLLVMPYIPGLKGAFRRKPVIYLAGGLFHLGLLAVILLSQTHMAAWKSQIGFGWPVLPKSVVSWLAAIGIVAMVALLINRLVDPVLRLISGPAEWMNWLLVFLPMATGFILARKLWLPYEVSFSIHMLLVDILLIWIPLSRISHFAFYFFARAIHGIEFQTRRVVNS